jgi:hypothetical protein
LLPNPANWRTHPQSQQDALRGLLAEVGYTDALLARELPSGTLMVIDSHLRTETTPDAIVPVLVLDFNEVEAKKILATLDPLAMMAKPDTARLDGCAAALEDRQSPRIPLRLGDDVTARGVGGAVFDAADRGGETFFTV